MNKIIICKMPLKTINQKFIFCTEEFFTQRQMQYRKMGISLPALVSVVSFTFPLSITSLKAGHPHPLSNLVSEVNNGSSQTTHR